MENTLMDGSQANTLFWNKIEETKSQVITDTDEFVQAVWIECKKKNFKEINTGDVTTAAPAGSKKKKRPKPETS